MDSPRILVFAYSDLGHACLKYLLDQGENVVAVFTHADQPGEKIWFPSVMALAEKHSVPVRTSENLNAPEELAFLRAKAPDLVFSFYYRNLIPAWVLQLPKFGAYNIHGSLLPLYRGRAPVNWAVLNGEKKTGATLHVMTEKADAGDIVDQEAVDIGPDDTAMEVQAQVTQAAVRALARQLENLKTGAAPRRSQDNAKVTYFGRRRPEDGQIDWTWPATRVHNLIRAVTHPYPGAFGELLGEKVWIWKSRLRPPAADFGGQARPGTIQIDKGCLFVVCGDGRSIEVLRIQKLHGEEMTGAEFLSRQMLANKGGSE